MATYTPGPWRYDVDTATIDNDLGVTVAGINDEVGEDIAEANAHLIAAAPELLAAVQKLLHVGQHVCIRDWNAAQRQAFDALTRALGPDWNAEKAGGRL
jgi:hypothetical protein